MNTVSFIDRKYMYFFEIIYRYISIPMVKAISKTPITPNMITISNFLFALGTTILIINNKYNVFCAVMILVYYLLDVIDGNLARYTGTISEFGSKLDQVFDGIYYNLIILAVGFTRVPNELVLIVLLIHNFYSYISTYYIVPRIKKISHFKRFGIKKYFMDRGLIIGVDLSLLGVLFSVSIISREYLLLYIIILILYIVDIVYRLSELWINIYLSKQYLTT